ncbi:gpW family head-tail joining protein [Marivita sp. S0852]|uniref:gpW family head-tail joining protein n=1 Tax=Marivita sp. S0852 TaxID=3373893 RepID=UPI003982234D
MATLAERLGEGENALHDLLLGQQAVEVRDSNGESVRFTPTKREELRRYIRELTDEIAGAQKRARMIQFQTCKGA